MAVAGRGRGGQRDKHCQAVAFGLVLLEQGKMRGGGEAIGH